MNVILTADHVCHAADIYNAKAFGYLKSCHEWQHTSECWPKALWRFSERKFGQKECLGKEDGKAGSISLNMSMPASLQLAVRGLSGSGAENKREMHCLLLYFVLCCTEKSCLQLTNHTSSGLSTATFAVCAGPCMERVQICASSSPCLKQQDHCPWPMHLQTPGAWANAAVSSNNSVITIKLTPVRSKESHNPYGWTFYCIQLDWLAVCVVIRVSSSVCM